jgi:hypothetical protein
VDNDEIKAELRGFLGLALPGGLSRRDISQLVPGSVEKHIEQALEELVAEGLFRVEPLDVVLYFSTEPQETSVKWRDIANVLLEGPMNDEEIAQELGCTAEDVRRIIEGPNATFELKDGKYQLAGPFQTYWKSGRRP